MLLSTLHTADEIGCYCVSLMEIKLNSAAFGGTNNAEFVAYISFVSELSSKTCAACAGYVQVRRVIGDFLEKKEGPVSLADLGLQAFQGQVVYLVDQVQRCVADCAIVISVSIMQSVLFVIFCRSKTK